MEAKKMSDSEVMVASVMELVAVLTESERSLFIGEFMAKYCVGCGTGDPRCQCQNCA